MTEQLAETPSIAAMREAERRLRARLVHQEAQQRAQYSRDTGRGNSREGGGGGGEERQWALMGL